MVKKKVKSIQRKYRKRPLTEYASRRGMRTITDSKTLEDFELRLNALEMKKRGASYACIASELEVSVGKATSLVKKALTELYEMEGDFAKEYRELQLQRLEALLKGLWSLATKEAPDYNAIDRVLKIIDQQARLSGLTQAITNNVFTFQQNNHNDSRQLTIVEAQEKSKKLQARLESMKESLIIKGEKDGPMS